MLELKNKIFKNEVNPQEMVKKMASVVQFDKLQNAVVQKLNEKKAGKAEKREKSKKLPAPQLRVSIGTLVEIERWAERARIGSTAYAFDPVLEQIKCNDDALYDAMHALTLAQIMPYQEIKRYLAITSPDKATGDLELVRSLSEKYQTSRENVVERIHHVRLLKSFLEEQKRNAKISNIIEE